MLSVLSCKILYRSDGGKVKQEKISFPCCIFLTEPNDDGRFKMCVVGGTA